MWKQRGRKEGGGNCRKNDRTTILVMGILITSCWMDGKKVEDVDWKLDEQEEHREGPLGWQMCGRMGTSSEFPMAQMGNWHKSAVWLEGQVRKLQLMLDNKDRNKRIKSTNGNRNGPRNLVKIIHWNMGSRFWPRKLEEVVALIEEKDPDLLFISEANLMADLPPEQRTVRGYNLVLPNTMVQLGYTRIILLIKEDINYKLLTQFMNNSTASIWVSLGSRGRRPLTVGGLYREHSLLRKGEDNDTDSPNRQLARWNLQLEGWKAAIAGNTDCVVIGDISLDFRKWHSQNYRNAKMVERTQAEIETCGFSQIVRDITRSWPGQEDSTVDHIWSNCLGRVVTHTNSVRASSDHNLISVYMRLKEKCQQRQEIWLRQRRNLDWQRMKDRVRQLNWDDLLECQDMNLINDMLVSRLTSIYDSEAPLCKIQVRKYFKSWVTVELKNSMKDRDSKRERARMTGDRDDWATYRRARNAVTKGVKKCRNEHFSSLYNKIAEENNTKELYNTTRELLGWQKDNGQRCFLWEGTLARKPAQLADIQMQYFRDKIVKLTELVTRQKAQWTERHGTQNNGQNIAGQNTENYGQNRGNIENIGQNRGNIENIGQYRGNNVGQNIAGQNIENNGQNRENIVNTGQNRGNNVGQNIEQNIGNIEQNRRNSENNVQNRGNIGNIGQNRGNSENNEQNRDNIVNFGQNRGNNVGWNNERNIGIIGQNRGNIENIEQNRGNIENNEGQNIGRNSENTEQNRRNIVYIGGNRGNIDNIVNIGQNRGNNVGWNIERNIEEVGRYRNYGTDMGRNDGPNPGGVMGHNLVTNMGQNDVYNPRRIIENNLEANVGRIEDPDPRRIIESNLETNTGRGDNNNPERNIVDDVSRGGGRTERIRGQDVMGISVIGDGRTEQSMGLNFGANSGRGDGQTEQSRGLNFGANSGPNQGLSLSRLNDPIIRLRKAIERWDDRNKVTEFTFREVSLEETCRLIRKLGNSVAFGINGLDATFIKAVLPSVAAPIRHCINVSLGTATWPNRWKIGKIFPLLKDKKADKLSPGSYRPVCILPTLSKIVERAAQLQIQEFLLTSGQLNTAAHAYRTAHSTSTTIAAITDKIYQVAEDRRIAQVMTIDQTAAFDCISHAILARKLKEYKISDHVITWVNNYLSNISNFVTVGAASSQYAAQTRGVPQGSVIGPLFYNIYVNDITETARDNRCNQEAHQNNKTLFGNPCRDCGTINTYADDSTYVVSNRNRLGNETRLKDTLERIKIFLLENELHMNTGKTTLLECMVPQKRARTPGLPPNLKVTTETGEEKTITDSGQCRILGINLQSNMTAFSPGNR